MGDPSTRRDLLWPCPIRIDWGVPGGQSYSSDWLELSGLNGRSGSGQFCPPGCSSGWGGAGSPGLVSPAFWVTEFLVSGGFLTSHNALKTLKD